MEKANQVVKVQTARFISVAPSVLKDIAIRMEFEAQETDGTKKKVLFQLTDDIVLYHDPDNTPSAEMLRARSASLDA